MPEATKFGAPPVLMQLQKAVDSGRVALKEELPSAVPSIANGVMSMPLQQARRASVCERRSPARTAGGERAFAHQVLPQTAAMVLSMTCADWITEMMLSAWSAPFRPICDAM